MKRIHVATISVLLAIAAVFGLLAVTRTTHLGAASRHAQDALVQQRAQQLSAFERSLRRQLAQSPATGRGANAPRVVYHRPPPIVITTHTGRGDDGTEGGGLDD